MSLPDSMNIETKARVAEKTEIRVATAPNTWPRDISEVLWSLLALGLGLGGAVGLNALGGSVETGEF